MDQRPHPAHQDPLTLDDLTLLLDITHTVAHKRTQRGTLPTPRTRNPHLTWDAHTFWDWARTNAPDVDQKYRPLPHWEPFACAPPRITHHHHTTLAVFTHPRGRIGLRMTTTGAPEEHPWPSDPDWDDLDVMGVVPGHVAPLSSGYDVYAHHQTTSAFTPLRLNTSDLSRIVGQPLPYWPSALRGTSHTDPHTMPAATLEQRRSEPVLLSALDLIPNQHPLVQPTQQLLAAMRWRSYEQTRDEIDWLQHGYFTAPDAPDEPVTHIAVMAHPTPTPEVTYPDWDALTSTPVGDTPAIRSAIAGISLAMTGHVDTRTLTLDGNHTSPRPLTPQDRDQHAEAVQSFTAALHPVTTDDVTYGHHRIREALRAHGPIEYLTHHLNPHIVAVSDGTHLTYTPPKTLHGATKGTPVDLTDPTNPLIQVADTWLPVPTPPDGLGVNAGYRGTGPLSLLQALGALVDRAVSNRAQSTLAAPDYPRRSTIGAILDTITTRAH